jgi:hypothetical protein
MEQRRVGSQGLMASAVGGGSYSIGTQTCEMSPCWAIAGNYSIARNVSWPRAEAIIWLDYPFHTIFWRLFKRTIRRSIFQEELWNGNRENFWMHLKLWSEESLFHWLFKTYWRRKREYPTLFVLPQNAHLKIIHFKHPSETEEWLRGDSHY